jgi:hypothetical protein
MCGCTYTSVESGCQNAVTSKAKAEKVAEDKLKQALKSQ